MIRDRWKGCLVALVVVGLVLSLLLNVVLGIGVKLLSSNGKREIEPIRYPEEFVYGSDTSKRKIAVIDLAGIILSETASDTGVSMVEEVSGKLRQAREDRDVVAVVLRIDSPGGEVNASDILYHEIAKTRAVKPVVVHMGSLAASGGFYAAMGANYVMANSLTLTGSIGVLMQTVNAKDLLDKVGVRMVTFKSGQFKDLLNPGREITPEEQQLVQGMVDATYAKFLGVVSTERKITPEALKNGLADGRVLSGEQAKAAGLIDGLGYVEDAYAVALKRANVSDAKVVVYQTPVKLAQLLRRLAKSDLGGMRVQLWPQTFCLAPGKLYFLPPYLFSAP